MNFLQMHERLRLELLRRIQRGSLSVSLLARQTGFGQSHISNFLHNRRQLSLEAMDRVLSSQHIGTADLLPAQYSSTDMTLDSDDSRIPLVSHATALFEPFIRPSAVRMMLHLPPGVLQSVRSRVSNHRHSWQRFVAVSAAAADALPMEPLVFPEAIVLLDRHYTSLVQYRPNRANLYAVRHGTRLTLRYVDFLLNRLVLRPHNIAFPVELIEIGPEEAPADLIVGRVALILNEL
jgi:hypothetical protein